MSLETEAADSLGQEGSPQADRHLAENFGLTVRQAREFDSQTLDATRACKFLGLPLKRFDQLASQPEARARWVEAVAVQKRELIATFPQASAELKATLEAIRRFALRKCLQPDGPARLGASGSAADPPKQRLKAQGRLVIGGVAIGVAVLAAAVVASLTLARGGSGRQVTPSPVPGPPATTVAGPTPPTPPPGSVARVVYSCRFADVKPFAYRWRPNTKRLALQDALPTGLWAGCYDPKSGGEFRVETVHGEPAFGLASRAEPPTAQLSIDAEELTGGLQAGHKYTLQFDYLTRGKPGASAAWLDVNHNVFSNRDFAETDGQWKVATLAVTRKSGVRLRVNFDSRTVTPDGIFYVRSLTITDDGK